MLDLAEETEKLAQLIARKVGKTPADVVREAVEASARAAGVIPARRQLSRDELIAGMKAKSDRCAALPVHDSPLCDRRRVAQALDQ